MGALLVYYSAPLSKILKSLGLMEIPGEWSLVYITSYSLAGGVFSLIWWKRKPSSRAKEEKASIRGKSSANQSLSETLIERSPSTLQLTSYSSNEPSSGKEDLEKQKGLRNPNMT